LRAQPLGHTVVERDGRGADAGQLRRQLHVVHGRVRDEHLRRTGEALGELVRADGVLHEDRVAARRQAVVADREPQPWVLLGHRRRELVGVHRHAVAEPLQMRGDRHEVRLAAAGGEEPVR
jgi:hypothetical protein